MEKRKCAFKNCVKSFTVKNPKKRFCSLSCKNKGAYQYKLGYYFWEIEKFKERRKNIQILEYLIKQNKTIVLLSELKLLGFEKSSSLLPFKNNLNETVFRFGNILMTLISKTECKIHKI